MHVNRTCLETSHQSPTACQFGMLANCNELTWRQNQLINLCCEGFPYFRFGSYQSICHGFRACSIGDLTTERSTRAGDDFWRLRMLKWVCVKFRGTRKMLVFCGVFFQNQPKKDTLKNTHPKMAVGQKKVPNMEL